MRTERAHYDYIYVDANNNVHVFVPLSEGDTIGTDNTCQSAVAVKTFFGQGSGKHVIPEKKALRVVNEYIADLQADLGSIDATDSKHAPKLHRLQQLQRYQTLLTALEQNAEVRGLADSNEPSYPQPISAALNLSTNPNVASIRLHPTKIDQAVRTPTPIFSFKRPSVYGVMTRNEWTHNFEAFLPDASQQALRAYRERNSNHVYETPAERDIAFAHMLNTAQLGESAPAKRIDYTIRDLALTKYAKPIVENEADFDLLKQALLTTITELGYPDPGFITFTYGAEDLTHAILIRDNGHGFTTPEEICGSLIGCARKGAEVVHEAIAANQTICNNLLASTGVGGTVSASPLLHVLGTTDTRNATLSILVQFFFGVAAIDRYEHTGHQNNIGQEIEAFNQNQKTEIIEQIKQALRSNAPEEGLLTIMERFDGPYFSQRSVRDRIITNFQAHYNTVKHIDSLDEFTFFLPAKQGKPSFYTFQNRIVLHLGLFCQHLQGNNLHTQYFTGNNALPTQVVAPAGQSPVKLQNPDPSQTLEGRRAAAVAQHNAAMAQHSAALQQAVDKAWRSFGICSAVTLGASIIAGGVIVPASFGLLLPIDLSYATMIGSGIIGIGLGAFYGIGEDGWFNRLAVGFGVFCIEGVAVAGLSTLGFMYAAPYLASTGLASEAAAGIVIGAIFTIAIAANIGINGIIEYFELQHQKAINPAPTLPPM